MVSTSGFCGYDNIFVKVSYLFWKLDIGTPTDCLPIADWYVFLGDWLWSGNGIDEANTPKIVEGWISQWV